MTPRKMVVCLLKKIIFIFQIAKNTPRNTLCVNAALDVG